MPHHLDIVIQEGVKLAVLIVIPLLIIPVASVAIAGLQGLFGVREESMQYAVRAAVAAVVLTVFGSSWLSSLATLFELALRYALWSFLRRSLSYSSQFPLLALAALLFCGDGALPS